MTNQTTDISQRKAALVAGLGLLIMTLPAVFMNFFVLEGLIVPGDAAATTNNIMANEMQYRIGIGSFIIVIILDVFVAWGLFVFLKPVNMSLSLLAAWFRLLYTAVFGFALLNLVTVLHLFSGAEYLTVFETDQLYAQVMLSLNAFNDGWAIGYVCFFGLHLIILGYLVYKSGYIPRILGVLLIIGGFGYLIDTFALLLLPNDEAYEAISTLLILPTAIGELLLALWLLIKGVKVEPSDKIALESA
ncbi:DUF4386 domain-containing protein [Chloroflexota bacterium]